MSDSGKMIVRCSGCGIRLWVKTSTFLAAGKVFCEQCTTLDARVAPHIAARPADDDQIVAWLFEGQPDDGD
jgi:hypothetical protein